MRIFRLSLDNSASFIEGTTSGPQVVLARCYDQLLPLPNATDFHQTARDESPFPVILAVLGVTANNL